MRKIYKVTLQLFGPINSFECFWIAITCVKESGIPTPHAFHYLYDMSIIGVTLGNTTPLQQNYLRHYNL